MNLRFFAKVLIGIICSANSMATPSPSDTLAQRNDVFIVAGAGQCELDCSETATEAEASAIQSANSECNPSSARRVSEWEVEIHGYGRLTVNAAFECVSKQ